MKKSMYRISLLLISVSLVLANGPVFGSETDKRIETTAKQSYVFKTYLKSDHIKIKAKDGAVTLTGTVSEEANKTLAGEMVASLPTVTSVFNELDVNGEKADVYSNAWLITKVKSTLLLHRNVNAVGTEVFAKNGTVTLQGKADSKAQMDLTIEYAKDVDGVKEVINEMTLDNASTTMGEKIDSMTETIDDASITALVKTALLYHRSTSSINTTVQTDNGVVRLGGKASSAAEKDLTNKIVRDVHGVKKVVNKMTVG